MLWYSWIPSGDWQMCEFQVTFTHSLYINSTEKYAYKLEWEALRKKWRIRFEEKPRICYGHGDGLQMTENPESKDDPIRITYSVSAQSAQRFSTKVSNL